jgi:hypothetical protein
LKHDDERCDRIEAKKNQRKKHIRLVTFFSRRKIKPEKEDHLSLSVSGVKTLQTQVCKVDAVKAGKAFSDIRIQDHILSVHFFSSPSSSSSQRRDSFTFLRLVCPQDKKGDICRENTMYTKNERQYNVSKGTLDSSSTSRDLQEQTFPFSRENFIYSRVKECDSRI